MTDKKCTGNEGRPKGCLNNQMVDIPLHLPKLHPTPYLPEDECPFSLMEAEGSRYMLKTLW